MLLDSWRMSELYNNLYEEIEMVKNNPKKVDNKFEIAAYFIDAIKLHWWKFILLIFAIGITVTGFKCKWGNNEVQKDPIYKKVENTSKK
jgi:hypothetical protein